MELADFSYFVLAPIMLIPLAAVYLTLRQMKWESRSGLFLDSWYVWLVWLVSTIFSYVALGVFTDMAGVYWHIPVFWWIVSSLVAIFLSDFFVISIFVLLLSRRNRSTTTHIIDSPIEAGSTPPRVTRIAFVTTIAAVTSLIISFGLASIIGAVYEHYNPRPKNEFEIYDI
jgi:hypothetical protein